MNKLLKLSMVAALTLGLAACAKTEGTEEKGIKVGMVTDAGTIDDKSFNQYTSELIKYLPDQGDLYSEQIEEYKEELINWSDLAEQEEGFFNE